MNIPFHNENFSKQGLDLNELLIKRKTSTFIMKIEGDSLRSLNIYSGDFLIIDRSKDPVNGSLIVAVLDSEFVVIRFSKREHKISQDTNFLVWGVITFIIHHAEKNNSAC